MLRLARGLRDELVAHCLAALPLEGCGLLVGDAESARVERVAGTRNAAASALRYEIDPAEHLRVDRDAQRRGLDVIGAFHSHTHTDAWPSSLDVRSAIDPSWHWVVISLRHPDAVLRSFEIRDATIVEEPVELT